MEELAILLDHNHRLFYKPAHLVINSFTHHYILSCYLRRPGSICEWHDMCDLVQAIKDICLRFCCSNKDESITITLEIFKQFKHFNVCKVVHISAWNMKLVSKAISTVDNALGSKNRHKAHVA